MISTLELHSKLFTLFSGFCFCFDVTRTIAKTMDLTFKFRTHSRATERQHSHWLALSMEFFTIHHTHSHHPRKILSRFCSAFVVHPSYGKRPVITHDSSGSILIAMESDMEDDSRTRMNGQTIKRTDRRRIGGHTLSQGAER